ncbi:hypothetical protein [Brevibacillus brevis]|uniref:hypothetical protein n=1 Tax=Brevibacillus brevis TaxID=1393 RepID=UPI00115B12AA|nr:hypothetical protein [Lysinibacillus sp. SDF0063]TQR30405.1 hypothetical protein C7Y45_26030 [Lysinibacillus sp. SDF0063]
MSGKLMTSIVLYGLIRAKEQEIWEWYQYFLKFNEKLGYPSTHLGIIGDSFKSGKLTTIKRTEAKLSKVLENGENIKTISIYSLPEEFTQAAFDYNTFICMNQSFNHPFVIVSVPSADFINVNMQELIADLQRFIICTEGKVFELSALESPLIYASKVNDDSDFSSLKIIEKFIF